MNTVTPEKKEGMLKALAVLGFLTIIGFIAWASVQIVAYAPKAFTSLASLAEGINQYSDSFGKDNKTLTLTSTTTVTETGTPVILHWNKQPRTGTYAFNYKCNDGVAIDIVDTEGLRSIACDTRYSLGDSDTVSIIVDSEKQAQTDVSYTISYGAVNDMKPTYSTDSTLTVTNQKLKPSNETVVLSTTDKTEWRDPISTPTKQPAAPVVKRPAVTPITTAPATNPTGFTDLATKFIATGSIVGNSFVPGLMKKNDEGAFQFTITNLGTKTSQTWSYVITLPSGELYTSPLQTPLYPGEQATIALNFSTTDKTTYAFVVAAIEKSDNNLKNNNFSQQVSLVR